MKSTARLALLLLFVTPFAASAQEGDAPPPRTLSDSEISEAFARMDSNRDGQLSLEEFEKGIARPYGSQREGVVYQKLPARFRVLDANADGFLDAGEYANLALRWQGEGAAPPPLSEADKNHDGRIDFREFAALHVPRDEPSTPSTDADAAASR
jgi:Ca2+-binding EF-hand superfamily protein